LNKQLIRIIYITALIVAFILLIVFYPAPADGSSYWGGLLSFIKWLG